MNHIKQFIEIIDTLLLEQDSDVVHDLEVVRDLETVYEDLDENISRLAAIVRRLPSEQGARARSMVLAHFQTALNHNHGWLGRNMLTLEDLINELSENNQ